MIPQTPIVVGYKLFCCTDSGVASCFDAKTGERHFLERLREGSNATNTSSAAPGGAPTG